MHHRPAGPPLTARLSGALARGVVHARRRARRVALGMALSTAVTGFVLAVPVVSSGSGTSPMSLDSSSSTAARHADETSPVVMGRDGAPASSGADVPVDPPVNELPAAPVTSTEVPVSPEASSAAPAAADAPATPDTPAAPDAPATPNAPSTTRPSTTRPSTTPPSTATSTAATSTGVAAPGAEGEVLALVNEVRDRAGCEPLVHDEGLARVARAHSADMRDRDFFDHTNPDDLDPFDRAEAAGQTNARAENIAYGQPDAGDAMEAWMDSSGHRANIRNCELRTLGVGVAEGPGGPWWTQLFGD